MVIGDGYGVRANLKRNIRELIDVRLISLSRTDIFENMREKLLIKKKF